MRPIYLGNDKWEKNQIHLNLVSAMNPHAIVTGPSGSGKTHTLRYLANQLALMGARVYLFDVHGDLNIGNSLCSTVKFSETSPYGINPLKISADPDYGGVRKKIRNFVAMLNRTSRKLGPKQESVMINLLRDLYSANGFYEGDLKTWGLDFDPRHKSRSGKKYPTMQDLERFAGYKLKQLLAGAGSKAYAAIAEIEKIHARLKRAAKNHEEEKLNALKEKYLASCREFVENIETGREMDDYIKYDSKEPMKSTYDRIVNLNSSGIFKSMEPKFDPTLPVHRYDISALSTDEQKIFIDIVAEEIFLDRRQRGIVSMPDTFIFIDEAKHFISSEPDHIVNILFTDARKFGIGAILGSQSITHFTEDILQSAATKIVLGLDDTFHSKAERLLKVDAKRFGYIVPQETALVQIRESGGKSSKYRDMILGY